MTLKAIAFNCTLKASDQSSSTELLLSQILEALQKLGVEGEILRMTDYDIKPGVSSDEGAGDGWPQLRRRLLEADLFVLGTPIWLGQPSSICKRVLERMDAFLGETDKQGRTPPNGMVATVAVVGSEDGAHHVTAELYQALADVGFTIPASGTTYWVGEAMGKTDFKDLKQTPETVRTATAMLAHNAVHLTKLLKEQPYPGYLAK